MTQFNGSKLRELRNEKQNEHLPSFPPYPM